MMSDWGLAVRFVLALALVLALIAAATWLARRYLGSAMMGGLVGRRRLSVVESVMLDGKSRLVLVRRDNAEHLLVLGPAGAAVVESGIPAPSTNGGSPATPATRGEGTGTTTLRAPFADTP
ncbi:MAG TPA: flagellar biosynthetic protein FliO [Alphaproteobacteria bacterium]